LLIRPHKHYHKSMSSKKTDMHISVSNQTIVRVIVLSSGAYFAYKFFLSASSILTLIFISFFLALALSPAVSWLASRNKIKVSRTVATAGAYAVVLTIVALFIYLVVPPLIAQSRDFIDDFPSRLNELKDQDSFLGDKVRRYDLQDQVSRLSKDWTTRIGDFRGPALSTANRILTNIASAITVLVLTFMMLVEGPKAFEWLWTRMPKQKAARAKKLSQRMYKVVTAFVNGQVIIAVISGFFALMFISIVSRIMNVDNVNAPAMAAIVTLMALVPTVGNIISAILVSLFCLFSSSGLAIVVLIYFVVYQQIENITIQPMIQSKASDLSPLLVFLAAILGIGLGGVLGGFVAIPAASCIKIILEDWLDDHQINNS
jgi:predicted PurR-regulated permease PerM